MKPSVLPGLFLPALLVLALVPCASAASNGGQAAVKLMNASATISQTSDTEWTLKKTGEVDSSSQTVTWSSTVTEGNTVGGHLVVYGFMTVTNTGAKPATIGNIVVNLQSKWGSAWETQSSDIADATHGDNATTAYIDPKASSENESQFSTNPASGKLDFMDATDNTVFSLEPQKTVAAGASVNLLFSAGFDNKTLKLSDGQSVRAEVIVSFGNSTSNSPSAANVDINGNGHIDADEAWVRSIPARITMTVPAQVAANQSVKLTDTASDIATTGTATFSNPTFSLGTTSGTVMVNYDGGTSGGKLTNCAHLKSADSTVTVGSYKFPNVNGIDLQACDTETITANSSVTAGWNNGDFLTYIQAAWSSSGSAATLLNNEYETVYASLSGVFVIGSTSKFTEKFSGVDTLEAYLPQTGVPGILTGSLLDPSSSSSGDFGGDVAGLKLNVDFYDAGFLSGSSSLKFGDLLLCNISSPTGLNGMTVRQFLSTANSVLGAASTAYTASDLDSIASQLNASFGGGTPSTFAQEHLFNGACPVWKNGDLVTYPQSAWGAGGVADSTLQANYAGVYAAANYIFQIGSSSGFTAQWSDSTILAQYMPSNGTPAALDANTFDATSTDSGIFGGQIAALKLNVDFGDAGILTGALSDKFGDLTLCSFTSPLTGLNGTSVRQFLATANTALGGGSTAFTIGDLNVVGANLDASFSGGTVSTWAQQHLRNGACQ
jgi:hypothetical protein